MFDDKYLEKTFYEKKELIDSFEKILSPEEIEILRNTPNLAIGEVAGKDSVAAIIEAARRNDIDSILPVAIYTGTLHGDWGIIQKTTSYIESEVKKRSNKHVHRLIVMGSPKLWRALNGRFMQALFDKYGFFSPCLGCHLYFHSIVIPLAKKINCMRIIAGERESHEGKIKLNQTAVAIDAYVSMLKDFAIELILPLRHVEDDAEIASIIGKEWEDEAQLSCVLSGNYKSVDGSVRYIESKSYDFFHGYAVPAASKIIKGIISGERSDYQKETGNTLSENIKKERAK
jgi:hypothetical protein